MQDTAGTNEQGAATSGTTGATRCRKGTWTASRYCSENIIFTPHVIVTGTISFSFAFDQRMSVRGSYIGTD